MSTHGFYTPALRAFRSGGEHILVVGTAASRTPGPAVRKAMRMAKARRMAGIGLGFLQVGIVEHASRRFPEHGTFHLVTESGSVVEPEPMRGEPPREVRTGKW